MRHLLLLLPFLAGLVAQEGEAPVARPVSAEDIAAFVLDEAPADAKTIGEIRRDGFKAGQEVVLRAQIAGRNPPWAPAHALMILADDAVIGKTRQGGCGAPWDYCSADPETVLDNSCVVRWKEEEGEKPRAVSFLDLARIAPLATVVVRGTVAEVADPQVLLIDLDGFHLEDRGPWAEWMDERLEALKEQQADGE